MPSLDTNCLLRWLLGDIPEQTEQIKNLLNSEKSVIVADVAIIETVFVLEKIKKINRDAIEKAIMIVLRKETIMCNKELFNEVLPVYTSHPKLSFADCYLEVLARKTDTAPLLTFDQKLASQLSGAKLLS